MSIKRKVKRLNFFTMLICILTLTAGFFLGGYAYDLICRNDCFVLNDQTQYDIPIGSNFVYSDKGVKIIEFGRDISDKVEVETNMTELGDGRYTADFSVSGRYYIKYTVDSPKYGEICRIRTFVVGGE